MASSTLTTICTSHRARFPELKVCSIENGSGWVPRMLTELDHVYGKMPQDFAEHPVEVFRRNVYVSPFWEDDVGELVDMISAAHVLFGSDYPHPEGLAEPLDYFKHLEKAGISDADQRRIVSNNSNELLSLVA
jgi:predicted TIM-barrel fold metal-dependent hydrolase